MLDTSISSPSGSSSGTFTTSTGMASPSILQDFSPPPIPQDEEGAGRGTSGLCRIGDEVYTTTSALAQSSLAHHGEFIGRGSLICALQSISSGSSARLAYASSTDACRNMTDSLSSISSAEREKVIHCLPPKPVATALIRAFFVQNNWRFGIPEQWFQSACTQMWSALEYPTCYNTQINANWLSLFFSMLAIASMNTGEDPPKIDGVCGVESSTNYFLYAMRARHISEDDHLKRPNVSLMASAADGIVLGCLAVPLLSCYLAQRGLVSEAWKLVGNCIRTAQAVGMHRDPEWYHWQVMSKDEVVLRRLAWWGLVIWDKMYSYLLGRPHIVRNDMVDVAVPPYIEPDGTKNRFNRALAIVIQLANIARETMEKCFVGEDPKSCSVFFDLDDKFQLWEDNLPAEYQQNRDERVTEGIEPAELMRIDRQRYSLITWYLICRIKLHLAAIAAFGQDSKPWTDLGETPKRCIALCIRQIRLQCDTHAAALQHRARHGGRSQPGSHWFFEGCISLAEAAVVLSTTLTRYPWKDKMDEAVELVDRAMAVLTHVVGDETGQRGETARMGAEVLGALREEDWWRSHATPASKYHPSIALWDAPVPSDAKSFDAEYESQWYDLNSSSFQSTQYNLNGMWNVPYGIGFTPDPSCRDISGVPHGRDIHMSDLQVMD